MMIDLVSIVYAEKYPSDPLLRLEFGFAGASEVAARIVEVFDDHAEGVEARFVDHGERLTVVRVGAGRPADEHDGEGAPKKPPDHWNTPSRPRVPSTLPRDFT